MVAKKTLSKLEKNLVRIIEVGSGDSKKTYWVCQVKAGDKKIYNYYVFTSDKREKPNTSRARDIMKEIVDNPSQVKIEEIK